MKFVFVNGVKDFRSEKLELIYFWLDWDFYQRKLFCFGILAIWFKHTQSNPNLIDS